MTSTKKLDMTPIAVRSLQTILNLADKVEHEKIWHGERTLVSEIAANVKEIFDLLAWSDGRLDDCEIKLLETLCAVDPRFEEAMTAFEEVVPAHPLPQRVPDYFKAFMEYDRRHNTSLTMMTVNALEILSHSIVAANGVVYDKESEQLRSYTKNLRLLTTVLA